MHGTGRVASQVIALSPVTAWFGNGGSVIYKVACLHVDEGSSVCLIVHVQNMDSYVSKFFACNVSKHMCPYDKQV